MGVSVINCSLHAWACEPSCDIQVKHLTLPAESMHGHPRDGPEKGDAAYTRAKMVMPKDVAIVCTRLLLRKQSTGVTEAPPESPVLLELISELHHHSIVCCTWFLSSCMQKTSLLGLQ